MGFPSRFLLTTTATSTIAKISDSISQEGKFVPDELVAWSGDGLTNALGIRVRFGFSSMNGSEKLHGNTSGVRSIILRSWVLKYGVSHIRELLISDALGYLVR